MNFYIEVFLHVDINKALSQLVEIIVCVIQKYLKLERSCGTVRFETRYPSTMLIVFNIPKKHVLATTESRSPPLASCDISPFA